MYRLLLYNLVFLIGFTCLWAKPTDEVVTHHISKEFAVTGQADLTINNKYGDIIIDTWSQDSIRIDITIKSKTKDSESSMKVLDRIDIDAFQTGNSITVKTIFDKPQGFFNEMWKKIGDYSKSLLNKSKVEIEYKIWLPAKTNLTINNKFGDIILNEVLGVVSINLDHGNFNSFELADQSRINLSFGKMAIKSMQSASIELKSAEVEIEKASSIRLKSFSSEVSIKTIDQLTLTSRSDDIELGYISVLDGTSSFSSIEIEELKQSITLRSSFGKLEIDSITESFTNASLDGRSNDYTLRFIESLYLDTKITTREGKLFLPDQLVKVTQEFVDQKEKFVQTTGFIGHKKRQTSRLWIDAEGGVVDIRILRKIGAHGAAKN